MSWKTIIHKLTKNRKTSEPTYLIDTPVIDIPVYEIDPKKKYILRIGGLVRVEERERLNFAIKNWLSDNENPFLVVNGDLVQLLKVKDADDAKSVDSE